MTVKPRATKRPQAVPQADAPAVPVEMPAEMPAEEAGSQEQEQMRRATELQIDEFMKTVGCGDPTERTDEDGWRWFRFRSAEGRAAVVPSAGEWYLRVEALVMPLPADRDALFALMQELLSINLNMAGYARLGIGNGVVFVTATAPVASLGASDVPVIVSASMSMADGLGGELSQRYGAVPQGEAAADEAAVPAPEEAAKPAPRSRKKAPKTQA
jgi:hypothetical protein